MIARLSGTLAEVTADNAVIEDALSTRPAVSDESPIGRVLRTVMADGQLTAESTLSEHDRVLRRRAAHAVHTALAVPTDVAVALLLDAAPVVPVAQILLEELADITVPNEIARAEMEKAEAHRRDQERLYIGSMPMPPELPFRVRT